MIISIHPPRVGWDIPSQHFKKHVTNFNPPTPCGVGRISTIGKPTGHNFNPPTPCGVGLHSSRKWNNCADFNPPTPCGVGQCQLFSRPFPRWISIHPPRVGWDSVFCNHRHIVFKNFNPPTPCGVGQCRAFQTVQSHTISIHPPRVGWDKDSLAMVLRLIISIHPPRVGWDSKSIQKFFRNLCTINKNSSAHWENSFKNYEKA